MALNSFVFQIGGLEVNQLEMRVFVLVCVCLYKYKCVTHSTRHQDTLFHVYVAEIALFSRGGGAARGENVDIFMFHNLSLQTNRLR